MTWAFLPFFLTGLVPRDVLLRNYLWVHLTHDTGDIVFLDFSGALKGGRVSNQWEE
jgi:hypothetical protein